MTYHGPYPFATVEAIAGPADNALMRLVPRVVSGTGMMRTVIGYAWKCGCETRGTGQPMCVWAACDEHDNLREQRGEVPPAIGYEDPAPLIVPISEAGA